MDQNKAEQRFKEALNYQSGGSLNLAAQIYEELLTSFPNRASVLINLSSIYITQRKNIKLDSLLPQLLNLADAMALLNAGTIYFLKGNKTSALTCFEKALVLCPQNKKILKSISFCLAEQKNPGRAAEYAKTLASLTNEASDWGRARYYFSQACDWENESSIDPVVSNYPFFDIARNISEKENFESANRFIKHTLNPELQGSSSQSVDWKPESDQVNLAYLCGEFREHATLKLLISVLEFHNTKLFNVFYLDNGPPDRSRYRQRLEKTDGSFISIFNMSDDEVIALTKDLRIDILINLNGFFGRERNNVFFKRAAPIQISFLGYPGTMGHPNIDFILADEIVIPKENQKYFTEKVVYLDHCYQPNDSNRPIPEYSSRKHSIVGEDKFTFVCLNNTYKITKELFEIWCAILREVFDSQLLLLGDNKDAVKNLTRFASREGLANQIIFSERLPTDEYVNLLSSTDLFLDTFPYNAHTTGTDALWAGVPILTIRGDTFPSRVGTSLLRRANLDDRYFVADTIAEYKNKAIFLAKNRGLLDKASNELREKVVNGNLFDMKKFTVDVEDKILKIYKYSSKL